MIPMLGFLSSCKGCTQLVTTPFPVLIILFVLGKTLIKSFAEGLDMLKVIIEFLRALTTGAFFIL